MKLSLLRNLIVVVIATVCAGAFAQLQRVPNSTLAMPSSPPTIGYTYTNAFSGLVFTNPICIVSPPGETNRLFILSKNGLISVITNLAQPNGSAFMDLTPQVSSQNANSGTAGERGLLGMAFHPGFATNGYFFILYMPTNSASGGYFDRLARFKISSTNPNQGDTNSQVVFYDQVDPDPNHNSGDIHFGADGYLYVSVGDEGKEYDGFNCAQIITNSLFSGILRIDVDKRAGNLNPNPGNSSLTVSGNYLIPADNPFIGITNFNGLTVNSNLVRTEFYAVGLRNPWRWNFDFNTNAFGTNVLYCGDVGQDLYEEVDVIEKGGNYGWAYWEGTNVASRGSTGLPHTTYLSTNGTNIKFPIVDYAHGTLTNQGHCVIGGVVYRGSNLPQLDGDYIYADYVQGNVWALVASNYTVAPTNINGAAGPSYPIFTDSGLNITAFGTDPRNGDVLFCATKTTGYATAATIDKIVYNNVTNGAPLPETLYDTGAFTNLLSLTGAQDPLQPAPGILPYTINVPFWSDNALKSRWFSIPNTNLTMNFNATGNWSFPTGMVWIKNFNIELTNGDPSSQIRLETRLLVKNDSGVYGACYIWNSKTNAVLAPSSGMDTNFVVNDGGILRTQTWHFPSQQECQTCHTSAGGFGLGFRTEQLNDTMDYGFGPTNEIQALSAAGYFSSLVTNDPSTLLALATATNTAYSLEFRARSFLQANCAQCHQPQGTVQNANWDARVTTPTALAGLINGALANNLGDSANAVIVPHSPAHSVLLTRDAIRDGFGDAAIQMPPIDSYLTDSEATNIVTEWILSMTNEFWIGASPDLQTVAPGNNTTCSVTFVPTPDFTSSVTLSVSGLPSGANGSFSPAIVNSTTTNSTLTITTTGATPEGTYTLTITGIGGGVTNTDTITLQVSSIVFAAPGPLYWTAASGSDTNWSTAFNWTNFAAVDVGVPGISNDVIFNNTASGLTNSEDFSTTINSLWFGLRPSSGGSLAHTIVIQPGTTLNVTGTNILTGSSFVTAGYSLMVGTNTSVSGNGNDSSVYANITGTGGTLNVSRPDGVIAVAEYISTGNHPLPASSTRAVLDMSGLDNFSADVSQLLIGCMANGSAGTIYFAKTNSVTASGGSLTGTADFDIGNNGSNPGDPSYAYLGRNNNINVNVLRVGGQKGYWGLLAFNPATTNQNPTAAFRGASGGNSRVANWVIADLIGASGTANVTCPRGTNDFTGGSMDVLVDNLVIGKTGTHAESALGVGTSSNRVAVGIFTFNAGTVNVNNLTNGWQLPGDVTDTGIGQVNVNGGTLTVNNQLVLASGVASSYVGGNPDTTKNNIVTNLYYGASVYATNAFAQGTLNINGGTVLANSIIAGGGISSVAMDNGTLVLTNTAGSPDNAIMNFTMADSALHLNLNGNSNFTNICVTNLVAGGVSTISIDSVANVTTAKTFPLISYNSFTGSVAANFIRGSLPAGFVAGLVDNSAEHRIDLSIAASTNAMPHFGVMTTSGSNFIFAGSNGLPNGIYYVLASTNVAKPLSQWTPVSTNPFDANGLFNFTNPMSTNAQLFYLLQLP